MFTILTILPIRFRWRCANWASTAGCLCLAVAVLAAARGGHYDCRALVPSGYQTAVHSPTIAGTGASQTSPSPDLSPVDSPVLAPGPYDSHTTSELQSGYASLMKEIKLGDFDTDDPTVTGVVPRLPESMGDLAGDDRKKAFIELVLPTVMVALDEVRQERRQFMSIVQELGGEEGLTFSEDQFAWQHRLGPDKTKFILGLTKKYRTTDARELADMINILPPSLIIAQGALESAWGGSRMALSDNNLFGMFASDQPRGLEYDSILDSVRAYILNINRLSAYKELRQIRLETLDPMRIAEGLVNYSERKSYYIADVKHIIELNRLQDYDTLILAAS